MNSQAAPFEGIRVFDLSQGIAAPYSTMLMAAQGADVIKVEPPGGDWIRHAMNKVRGHPPAFIAVNVGKRSIVLDLKQPADLEQARQIARTCDVVVESFRPGVTEKYGLDAQTLCAENPALVYCSVNGFGRHSKGASRPVVDQIAQAFSGWMHLNRDAGGTPQRTKNVVLADQITGLYAFQAISSALLKRFRFGTGSVLEVTLAGSMAAFLAPRITSHLLSDGRVGNAEFMPPTGDFPTGEGTLVIAVQKPADVERLLRRMGRAEMLEDARFATPAARIEHRDALLAEVRRTLQGRSALDWESHLAAAGVMACAVRDVGGFLAAESEMSLGLVEEIAAGALGACPVVRVPGAPSWSGRSHAPGVPELGEHGAQILQEVQGAARS